MKTTIKDIAQIQTGIFAKPAPEGEVVYLQTKHFDEAGQLTTSLHPDLTQNSFNPKHLLIHGDVLFSAKGTKNFATCYENINPPAVASTSFFVLRVQNTMAMPEYLSWYLNQPSTLSILKSFAKGSNIPSISKETLEQLEIYLPSIEKQKAVVKLAELKKKEKLIQEQILKLKETLFQNQLLHVIRK